MKEYAPETTKTDLHDIATAFVDVVTKYNAMGKENLLDLMTDEIEIVLNLLRSAGFDPQRLVTGNISGKDGHLPINLDTQKIVIDHGDKDNRFATGWLNQMVRTVRRYSDQGDKSLTAIVTAIIPEIERSIPLTPIKLTNYGDLLGECPRTPKDSRSAYFGDHVKDDSTFDFGGPVGIHLHCGGYIDLKRSSPTYNALLCRACQLRVMIGKEINSYQKLRERKVE